MRNISCMFLLLLTVSLWAVEGEEAENHAPLITNVLAKQIEQRVKITYDVSDADGDLMTVKLLASSDGGKNFDLPVKSVEGEIGEGIASGKGQTIIWYIAADIPDFYSTNVVFEVVADDGGPAERITWEKDRAKMVLIPASSFEIRDVIGSPVHKVELDAFFMDVHEVTVGQFKKFVNQSEYEWWPAVDRDDRWKWNKVAEYSPTDNHPMIYVQWHDATAYAKWAGKRLPTEVEWEYAARGGLIGERYPWGDDESLARDYANYKGTGGKDKWDQSTSPVGSFKPNGYGLYDMAGNAWEWTADWFDEWAKKLGNANNHVQRGGSWNGEKYFLPVSFRISDVIEQGLFSWGFRCVVSESDNF